MSKIEEMLQTLVGKEGGYVDHPSDRGGETNWGITIAVARAFGYSGPMRTMSRDTALQIYRERYWLQPGFDKMEQVDRKIAERLFDIGVNMGQARGAKMLQRVLNVLNRRGSLYSDIKVDGQAGAMTRASLLSLIQHRGERARVVVFEALRSQQAVRYIEIGEGDVRQEDFAWGWLSSRAFVD